MGIETSFAKKLLQARQHAGFSQKAIADKLGISVQTYNGYETKGYEPKFEVLLKICAILDTSPNELIGYVQQRTDANDYALAHLDNFKRLDNGNIEYSYQYYGYVEAWEIPVLTDEFQILIPESEFNSIIETCYLMAEVISDNTKKRDKERIFKKSVERSVLDYYSKQQNKTAPDTPISETDNK